MIIPFHKITLQYYHKSHPISSNLFFYRHSYQLITFQTMKQSRTTIQQQIKKISQSNHLVSLPLHHKNTIILPAHLKKKEKN